MPAFDSQSNRSVRYMLIADNGYRHRGNGDRKIILNRETLQVLIRCKNLMYSFYFNNVSYHSLNMQFHFCQLTKYLALNYFRDSILIFQRNSHVSNNVHSQLNSQIHRSKSNLDVQENVHVFNGLQRINV